MGIVTDRSDLGDQSSPVGQYDTYLALPEEERKKGFVRPLRRSYVHQLCGTETRMAVELAETYARDPSFYGATFCCHCNAHYPVGEFVWLDDPTQKVGS